MDRFPNVFIKEPLAATRSVDQGSEKSAGVAGNTHSSAPESTRKDFPDRLSYTEMVPLVEPTKAIDGWHGRFPVPDVLQFGAFFSVFLSALTLRTWGDPPVL